MTKEYNPSKFQGDRNRDANKPGQGQGQGSSHPGMGKESNRPQQGGTPGEPRKNPSESDRNR